MVIGLKTGVREYLKNVITYDDLFAKKSHKRKTNPVSGNSVGENPY